MQVRLKTCDMLSAMGATSFEEKLNKKTKCQLFLKVYRKQFTVLPLSIYSYHSL